MRSRCLSPVGVDARTPGQLGFVGFARVAQRQIIGSDLSSQSTPPLNTPTRKEHLCGTRFGVFGRPNSRTRPASCLRRSRPLPPRARCTPEEAVAQGCCDFLVRCILSKGRAHVGIAQGVVFRSSLCHLVCRSPWSARQMLGPCSSGGRRVGLHHQPAVAANGTLTRPCHP